MLCGNIFHPEKQRELTSQGFANFCIQSTMYMVKRPISVSTCCLTSWHLRIHEYTCISVSLPLRLSVDVFHVHFEVVVAGELLVAEWALRHGPVGIVGKLVPDQHLLQTERQVANLQPITEQNRRIQTGCVRSVVLRLSQLAYYTDLLKGRLEKAYNCRSCEVLSCEWVNMP